MAAGTLGLQPGTSVMMQGAPGNPKKQAPVQLTQGTNSRTGKFRPWTAGMSPRPSHAVAASLRPVISVFTTLVFSLHLLLLTESLFASQIGPGLSPEAWGAGGCHDEWGSCQGPRFVRFVCCVAAGGRGWEPHAEGLLEGKLTSPLTQGEGCTVGGQGTLAPGVWGGLQHPGGGQPVSSCSITQQVCVVSPTCPRPRAGWDT